MTINKHCENEITFDLILDNDGFNTFSEDYLLSVVLT